MTGTTKLEGADKLFERSEFLSATGSFAVPRHPTMTEGNRTMQLTVNAKPAETTAGSTLQNLLDQLRLDSQQVVVERNGTIVPRQRFAEEFLAEGDSLEIVHFVGGG